MTIRVISGAEVLLSLPMPETIEAMKLAFVGVSSGSARLSEKHSIGLADDSGAMGVMMGSSASPGAHGLKAVTIKPDNVDRELPVLQGAVLLFDPGSGTPSALIDAGALTATRTAAASGLATQLLARPEASVAAIFGCGVQAASHLDAMLAVRQIERFIVWGRCAKKAARFCEFHNERLGIPVEFQPCATRAAQADIICTVTSATEPVLEGKSVVPGTHINLVGSHDAMHREADSALIAKSSLFTDRTEHALTSAGEIVSAIANRVIEVDHIRGELGELAQGKVEGRESKDQITVFKSLGLIVQDLIAADLVLRQCVENGRGTSCAF